MYQYIKIYWVSSSSNTKAVGAGDGGGVTLTHPVQITFKKPSLRVIKFETR